MRFHLFSLQTTGIKMILSGLTSIIFICACSFLYGQKFSPPMGANDSIPKTIKSMPAFSDSLCSSFFITIEQEVKLHRHNFHSEHVYILEGKGKMQLGEEQIMVQTGDLIFIPKGKAHGLKVTEGPVKVLSIQAPFFDGTDREWIIP